MLQEERRGVRAAVLAYSLWGLFTLYWKQLDAFGAFDLIGWRIATAALVMTVVVLVLGRRRSTLDALRDPSTLKPIVLAATLLTVNWTTYVWAVVNDRVIETALGYFLAPLGTMALGVFVLGEALTTFKRWSIGCAALAVVILTVSYGQVPWVSLLLAATWSFYGLTKRRVPLDPIESLSSELAVLFVPALGIVAWSWFRDDGVTDVAVGVDWLVLLGTGAVTTLPLLLFAFAAQRVPFTVLGPTQYLIPLINFFLGWLVFDEPLPASRVAGFVLVWLALGFVTADLVRGQGRTRRDVNAGEPVTPR